MNMKQVKYTRYCTAVQAGGILLWLAVLMETDAYFSVYLLCAFCAFFCLGKNYNRKNTILPYQQGVLRVASVIFSGSTILANYPLFLPLNAASILRAGTALMGGSFVGCHILRAMMDGVSISDNRKREHPERVFFISFLIIAAIDLTYLFSAMYPGILTRDSMTTVRQMLGGTYQNTMPFFHTITVEMFFEIGMMLFQNINMAIALFHVAQILFLAAVFAYTLTTMYQAKVPLGCIAVFFAVYALMCYNVVYSVTLWKDVPFSGAALLLVTSLYRCVRGIGNSQKRNYVLFAVGALGFSLWRTNGWYAFAVTTLIMAVTMRKTHRRLLKIMVIITIVCWLLINPLLNVLGVSSTDMVEAFSVPLQQIARTIVTECPLTQEETALLSQLLEMDNIKELYNPGLADPIKFIALRRDNMAYIRENFFAYVKLYLRLGLRYPGQYLRAWVEQTKGYWNGGYDYWIFTSELFSNDYGIQRFVRNEAIAAQFAFFWDFQRGGVLFQPLLSIGLHVWIIIACFLVNCCKKRSESLLAIPLLVLMAGLWLGTPVFAEFRYAYPFFICMPIVMTSTLFTEVETVVISES